MLTMRIEPIETLGQTAKYLLIVAALLYLLDWGVFALRRTRGTAMGSVAVDQYLQTPLKGGKAEYDYMGTADQPCSRTLFPQYALQQWRVPCWWLARHNSQWE